MMSTFIQGTTAFRYDAEVVAHSGERAPGTSDGFVFSQFALTAPDVDADGGVLFTGDVVHDSDPAGAAFTALYRGAVGDAPELITVSSRPVPGAPGLTFGYIYADGYEADRSLFFAIQLDADGREAQRGLFLTDGAEIVPVVQEGDTMPGTDAARLLQFGTFAVGPNGTAAFDAELTGPDARNYNDGGLFAVSSDGTVSLIVREGEPLDTAEGPVATFGFFEFAPDGEGGVVFLTDVREGNGGFGGPDAVIHREADGSATILLEAGDPVAGTDSAMVAQELGGRSFYFGFPSFDGAAAVVAVGLVGTGLDDANDEAIVLADEDGVHALVREGDQVEALGGASVTAVEGIAYANGRLAFVARLTGEGVTEDADQALLVRAASGTFDLVAMEGDEVVIGGARRTIAEVTLSADGIGEDGTVGYAVYYEDDGGGSAIFRTSGGPNEVIGTEGGEEFGGTDGIDRMFGLAGDDLLFGLDGADLLIGGTGDDVLYGDGA